MIKALKRLISIHVKVKPGSKVRQVTECKVDGGNITMSLKILEEAQEGQANEGVRKYLAKEIFEVSMSQVEIVRGYTSREKIVGIEGLDLSEAIN